MDEKIVQLPTGAPARLYRIADVSVEMAPRFPLLKQQSEPYAVMGTQIRGASTAPAEIRIALSPEFLEKKVQRYPHLSAEMCEYLWSGLDFYRRLPLFGGMMLHASCIAVDGEGYLFSAPCGTGKSTHTALWKKRFGSRAVYVNDDKPALRFIDGRLYAYGTPFSGKTDLNRNLRVPVRGICMLERGSVNKIRRIDPPQALPLAMNQIYRPAEPEAMRRTLELLDLCLKAVPWYRLSCDVSDEAVETSYAAMSAPAPIRTAEETS